MSDDYKTAKTPTDDASGARKVAFRRRKSCPFSGPEAPAIDWKDPRILGRYISERGKMMPSRITLVCQKKQRELANAIKRARFMAILPYVRIDTESRYTPRTDRTRAEF